MKANRSITLEDGSTILVRAIHGGDGELLARMFERLSHDARRRRFRGRLDTLGEEDLDYLTDVDGYRHDALVAIEPDEHEAVGVARFVRLPGRRELAEVAVEVLDEWQRRGVATALLLELTDRARAAGIESYSAIVDPDNEVITALLDRLGAEPLRETEHGVEYTIDLSNPRVTDRLTRAIGS
jgi:RimJ/RimL family protein N-acetyltransferase